MQVTLIDDMPAFEAMRPAWDRAHALDPQASVFVAWGWLRGWFDVSPYPWAVLAARPSPGADPVAFLPVSIRGSLRAYRMDQVREVHMAGDPGADYTGLVCDPAHTDAALRAFAAHFNRELPWDRIRFKEVNDPRIERMLQLIGGDAALSVDEGTCCPFIPLPDTWDAYTQDVMSYETRKSLRKKLRLAETELRITHMGESDRDASIETLVTLAGMRKRDDPNPNLPRCKRIFQGAAEAGLASIILVWKDQTPIAGMGSFWDRHAKSLCFYLTGYDDRFGEYSAGRVVNAVAIRHAIENGCRVLDFLRGDEPYKFQFGAQRRFTKHYTVTRKSLGTNTRMALSKMRERLGI